MSLARLTKSNNTQRIDFEVWDFLLRAISRRAQSARPGWYFTEGTLPHG